MPRHGSGSSAGTSSAGSSTVHDPFGCPACAPQRRARQPERSASGRMPSRGRRACSCAQSAQGSLLRVRGAHRTGTGCPARDGSFGRKFPHLRGGRRGQEEAPYGCISRRARARPRPSTRGASPRERTHPASALFEAPPFDACSSRRFLAPCAGGRSPPLPRPAGGFNRRHLPLARRDARGRQRAPLRAPAGSPSCCSPARLGLRRCLPRRFMALPGRPCGNERALHCDHRGASCRGFSPTTCVNAPAHKCTGMYVVHL